MKLPVKGKMLAVLVPAFILYFWSESVLRQGTISSIDSKKLNIDMIISELPGAIRDEASYRIHFMQLKEAIKVAGTDGQKILALSNMADFIREPEKRVELYTEVFKKYPNSPESLRAYTFFLKNNETKINVSVNQFIDFVRKMSVYDRYYALSLGLSKLRKLDVPDNTRFRFLKILLEKEPEYRDYSTMYQVLADLCSRMGKTKEYKVAVKYEEISLDKPMLETVYMEHMEKIRRQSEKGKQEEKK